jgi:hypothetical protein
MKRTLIACDICNNHVETDYPDEYKFGRNNFTVKFIMEEQRTPSFSMMDYIWRSGDCTIEAEVIKRDLCVVCYDNIKRVIDDMRYSHINKEDKLK